MPVSVRNLCGGHVAGQVSREVYQRIDVSAQVESTHVDLLFNSLKKKKKKSKLTIQAREWAGCFTCTRTGIGTGITSIACVLCFTMEARIAR